MKQQHRNWENLAPKVGISSSGLRKAVENETVTVKLLEKLAVELKKPLRWFFDKSYQLPANEFSIVGEGDADLKLFTELDQLRKENSELKNKLIKAMEKKIKKYPNQEDISPRNTT